VYRNLLIPLLVSVIAGCNSNSAPVVTPAPVAVEPIVQGNQLRFPSEHPHLALLTVSAAQPSKKITVELPAKLVWNEARTQRIYPAFAGRVVRINADVGQKISAGAVLAQFASPDFGSAQADVVKAQADAQLSQKTLARQKELLDAGIIARKDLDIAQADAARTQAEVSRSQARTALYSGAAGIDQQLGLRASLGGVVVERNLNPGQEVRPDQSGPGMPALFVVSDPTQLWVQIDARESEIATLLVGANFELAVASLPGQKFEGTVTAVSDSIDPSTRTIKVRGSVANPKRLLKAEMLATARIERTLGAGVVIPTSAVSLRGTRHVTFVQVQPGIFEPRDIVLGYQGPKEVVVSSGLEVGEQVVSENMLLLASAFRISQDAAQAAALSTPAKTGASAAGKAEPKAQGSTQ
jgi:membrane fusion protein, heavy metal efflux system